MTHGYRVVSARRGFHLQLLWWHHTTVCFDLLGLVHMTEAIQPDVAKVCNFRVGKKLDSWWKATCPALYMPPTLPSVRLRQSVLFQTPRSCPPHTLTPSPTQLAASESWLPSGDPGARIQSQDIRALAEQVPRLLSPFHSCRQPRLIIICLPAIRLHFHYPAIHALWV